MNTSRQDADAEKKAPLDAASSEYQAPSLSHSARRRVSPWLACLALALLVFAGSWTTDCVRLPSIKHDPPVPDALAVDAIASEESPSPPRQFTRPKHLAVEPIPVAIRQVTSTSSAAASPTVLECFQVAPPVLTPHGPSQQTTGSDGPQPVLDQGNPTSASCSVLLMEHSFGFSYGKPFVGEFARSHCNLYPSPPSPASPGVQQCAFRAKCEGLRYI
jgi:hypothetical protein